MSHALISYVRDNLETVVRLRDALQANGVKVWLDRDSIKPGDWWEYSIRNAISEGNFFIACFSQEYQRRAKSYFNEELTLAIDELRQRQINNVWFIPVMLDSKCSIPDVSIGRGKTLHSINWVELYANWDEGIQSIVEVIKPDMREANLSGRDFSKKDLSGINLSEANLSGENLRGTDLRKTSLIDANLDNANLTGSRLWAAQREGWSIKGVKCEYAFFDRDGSEATHFEDGEFEKLYGEKIKIHLYYEGGINLVELSTLPALIQQLETNYKGCSLLLQSVQDDAGGATVTLVVDELGQNDSALLRTSAEEIQTLQLKLRTEEKQRIMLQGQMDLMMEEIFPTLLERTMSRDTYNISTAYGPVFLGHIAPVAWAHINLLGEYDFSDEKLRDSVGVLPLKSTA